MFVMKRLLSLIIILSIAAALVLGLPFAKEANSLLTFSLCGKPIYYSIGKIDNGFQVTETQLIEKTLSAAEIWNRAVGKDIFIYKPDNTAHLTVNLVYDGRQTSLSNINTINVQVSNDSDSLKKLIAEFNVRKEALNLEVEALNNEVKAWNEKGGAPKDDYQKLIEKREAIQREIDAINREADILNNESTSLKEKISYLNDNVDEFNTLLKSKPEEGIFDPLNKKIDVYFYETDDRYIHTAAHEFGHALGLDHLEIDGSIMNPVSSDTTQLSTKDMELLTEYCKERNRIEYMMSEVKFIWEKSVQPRISQI